MNKEQAKELAIFGVGKKITHEKGCGEYTVIGFCRVQIRGSWKDAIQYRKGGDVYVRLVTDCEKIHLSKEW